ncbi:MAG: D-alanyl-D-alanine carboxypeptidase [Clostridia bacterium]|nr:D-alanyl-D-alanine carboxypeptidase [Clostridia bacterium]
MSGKKGLFSAVFSAILIFIFTFSVSAEATAGKIAELTEDIPAVLVYDVTADTVLYSKNSNERIPPASTAKLVTALVALEHADKEEIFPVGTELSLVPDDSSLCLILEGHRLKTKTFIAGMLLRSGGDAAYSLAVNIAKKCGEDSDMTDEEAIKYFCSLMNSYCESLGCKNTNFVSPDGWDDEGNYTTAEDMLLVAKKALKNETLMTIAKNPGRYFYFASGENILWESTNLLLIPGNEYYCPYVTGLKTGTSDNAGSCIVASAEKDGNSLLVLSFGGKNDKVIFGAAKNIIELIFGIPFIHLDADENGTVSAADARIVLRASVGLEEITDRLIAVTDSNRDGRLTASDARYILRFSVGLEGGTNDEGRTS